MLLALLFIGYSLVWGETEEAEQVVSGQAAALRSAASLLRDGKADEAVTILSTALETNPADLNLLKMRALCHETREDWPTALADYDRLVKLDPTSVDVWQNRGEARFMAGDVKGSIADFDKAIQLDPNLERRHWQRGLSYYYDGQYEAGAKQFALYQTYHAADVENVSWRFLCQAQYDGVDKARSELMKLDGVDRRVPMMEIDALYRGTGSVDTVMAAAGAAGVAPDAQKYHKFYAHLYVGLYLHATGQADEARKHILAADALKNDHYMWYVAHLHAERLRKGATP
jgi:lipoprotein NlpI